MPGGQGRPCAEEASLLDISPKLNYERFCLKVSQLKDNNRN